MAILPTRTLAALSLTSLVVIFGTLYGIINHTYLDTSNPLLTNLPHPSHKDSYFASKGNVLNQWFVKLAWGWTSAAFWAVWITAQEDAVLGGVKTIDSIGKWLANNLVWMVFASWFFGPSLFSRITAYSGAECVISVPAPSSLDGSGSPAQVISVPTSFCEYRTTVTPETHPALFAHPPVAAFFGSEGIQPGFKAVPRLYKGHDVSGHTFLLTLSVLFLVDTLVRARRGRVEGAALVAQTAGWLLVVLWLVMLGATAVYFHTWQEKASGFVIAVVGYIVAQWPFDSAARSTPPPTVKEAKALE